MRSQIPDPLGPHEWLHREVLTEKKRWTKARLELESLLAEADRKLQWMKKRESAGLFHAAGPNSIHEEWERES